VAGQGKMTKISVHGIKHAKTRNLIKHQANWLIRELIGVRMHLKIDIIFLDSDEYYGVCERKFEDDFIRPRSFTISIANNSNLRRILRTLAHEIVHVKQYARNELYDYQKHLTLSRWHNSIVDVDKVIYRKHPWELEAFSMETSLVNKYIKEHGIDLKEYTHDT